MADESSVFDLLIRGHFEGIRGMEKLHAAIQDASKDLGVMSPRSLKRLEKQIGGVAKSFNDVFAKAGSRDLGKLTERIRTSLDKAGTDLRDQFVKIKDAAEALNELQAKGSAREIKAAERTLDAEKEKMAALQRRLKKEAAAIDAMIDRREKAEEFLSKSRGEIGADLADGLAEGLSKLSSGDVRGLTDAVAGGLKTAGSMAGTGGGGAAIAKLGAAAVALSGAVLAISAIVKILIDADSQTKDWNKSLLQTAGAADFALDRASGGFKDLEGDLNAARDAALSVAWEFRQMPEDMLKTLAAANEAGFTFKEMADKLSDTGDSAEAFRNMTRDSLVYAKALGVSTEEIAQMTAGWMHDFGGGLDTIREGYSAIFQASLEAGIGSKRFFTMVQQATAGLALYNVRVEQTAALIAELSKTLGEEDAASFVTDLQKGFTDESMTDRFKRIMTSGGAARRVIGAEARNTGRTFRERAMSGTGAEGIREALVAAGAGGNNEEMLKGLADLTAKDRRALVRRVTEYDKQAGQQLDGLIDLAKGMEGGIGAQAKALDNLSAGGKLAMQLQSAMGVIGSPLSEMTAIEMAGFEQMTGIQGEALEKLKRVDQQIRADYELAKEQGRTDKTLEQYIISRGSEFQDALENTQPIMEQMTQQLVSNSESMLNLLSTTFKYLLEGISNGITFLGSFAAGMSQGEREAQQKVLQDLSAQQDDIRTKIAETELALNAEGLSESDRSQLEEKKGILEGALQQNAQGRQKVATMVGGIGFANWDEESTSRLGGLGETNNALWEAAKIDAKMYGQQMEQLVAARALGEEGEEQTKLLEDLPKDITKAQQDAARRESVAQLIRASGMDLDNRFLNRVMGGDQDAIAKLTASLKGKDLADPLRATAQGLNINPSVDDFIMRGNTVTPINRADQLLGAKPGGPVDRGGVGRGGNININVYGGDQAKVYETVKRALRESGVRPTPGRRG